MAYTTPPTFVADEVLTAAQLNVLSEDIAAVKDEADIAAFAGINLWRTSVAHVPTSDWVGVTWNYARLERGGNWWSTGTNITVPTAVVPDGYTSVILEVSMQSRWEANGTGTRSIRLTQNGSTVEYTMGVSALAGETTTVSETVWAVAAAGDVLRCEVYQGSGTTLDLEKVSIRIKRIGAIP